MDHEGFTLPLVDCQPRVRVCSSAVQCVSHPETRRVNAKAKTQLELGEILGCLVGELEDGSLLGQSVV
jgi:hypothetical protein